jgi:ribosomal protein L7/L12
MMETIKCPNCGTTITLPLPPTGFVDVVIEELPQGKNDIERIKKLRAATEIDLALAKFVLTNTPWVTNQNIPAAMGQQIVAEIEQAGGKATLKPA